MKRGGEDLSSHLVSGSNRSALCGGRTGSVAATQCGFKGFPRGMLILVCVFVVCVFVCRFVLVHLTPFPHPPFPPATGFRAPTTAVLACPPMCFEYGVTRLRLQ